MGCFLTSKICKEWKEIQKETRLHVNKCSWSTANPGDIIIVCILLYNHNLLVTSPNPFFYDRTLQVLSYQSQTFVIALLLAPSGPISVTLLSPLNVAEVTFCSFLWYQGTDTSFSGTTCVLHTPTLYLRTKLNILEIKIRRTWILLDSTAKMQKIIQCQYLLCRPSLEAHDSELIKQISYGV